MSLRNPPLIAAALFVFAFAASVGRARAQETPIALTVDASEAPVTSIVHVHETIPVTPDAPLDLAYPRWVPGEHGPSGPVANVAFLRASYLGKAFDVTRDLADPSEFHVTVPADVSSVDIDFDYLGSKDGTYGESRLATATILAVNWNQFLVYPQNADITTLRFAPTLILPGPAWTAETALPGPVRTGDRISFATATLERLVDSPLDAGTAFRRFMLLDAGGFTNEIDAFADRPEQLALPDKELAGFKAVVGEMDAIYGARHWKNYHFLLTVSDAMPGNGVEHGSSSDDGNDGNGLTDPAGIIGTAGLLAHEFNHSWDGKYRRPADLATNNFQVPEETDLLWIYEGMTQFYGDLVPTRAGLWTPEYYRDTLALGYAREDQEPGRSVRPLADTAAAAPVLYPAARSLSGERRTAGDFYTEGELLWLDVAAKIDADSQGKKSLDGFCRRFFGIADTPSQVNPYTYAQFVAALSDYAPGEWDAYFQSRVYRLAAHPPDGFEKLGWRLVYTDVPNLSLARSAKLRHSSPVASGLGITVDDKGLVSDVLTDSPAARGGLGYGDTIVAIDNREFDVDSYADAVKATKDSTAPLVMIVKRNGIFRTLSIVYRGGLRYPHLERIAGTPDRLSVLTAPHRI